MAHAHRAKARLNDSMASKNRKDSRWGREQDNTAGIPSKPGHWDWVEAIGGKNYSADVEFKGGLLNITGSMAAKKNIGPNFTCKGNGRESIVLSLIDENAGES